MTSCGQSGTFHDLNGDGYVDAVVGDPYAPVGGAVEAGTVTVLFGGADGRIGEGDRRVLTQRDFDETPETGDHFGWSVSIYSAWYFDGSCNGLIIGAPGEDVDGHDDAGMAHVYGPLGGEELRVAAISVDQSDVGGTVENGDAFGFSVAATDSCDADHENYCLPVFHFGAPGENDDAGVVNSGDLVGWGHQLRQGFGGLPGRMQAGDRFGEVIGSLSYLPEDWDTASLYIGAPGDVVGGKRGAGSVTVSAPSPRLITQNTPGVPGTAETGDHFGASMASGSGAFDQLAIGAPGENVGSVVDAGSVTVLKRTGETIYPATVLTQATKGVSGTVERGDQFGAAVAYRDDRTLAIGVPREDLGTVRRRRKRPDRPGRQVESVLPLAHDHRELARHSGGSRGSKQVRQHRRRGAERGK